MLSFKVRASPVTSMLRGIETRAADRSGILRRWLGFMRKKARQRFDELSGPPLAASTRARYEQTRTSSVTAAGNVRASYARNAERALRTKYRDKRTGQVSEKGQALIAELRRLSHGGDPSHSMIDSAERSSVETLRKKLLKAQTGRRVGGEKRRIERHRLLGRLVGALEGGLTVLAAILRNRVPWSNVHDKGGTAGHNANIPQRNTLRIEQSDVDEMSKITVQHLLGQGRKR